MPFGERNSSLFMMSISNFISRALMKRGVQVLIYLNDMLSIRPGRQEMESACKEALALLRDLGLHVAHHKLTPPSRQLFWSGICLNLNKNTLSISQVKLDRMWTMITCARDCHQLTVKQMQSIIRTINHIGKAVPPARLFVCRPLNRCEARMTTTYLLLHP